MNKATGIFGGIVVAAVVGIALGYNALVGYNESGQRQFVQTYMGSESVVYTPGPFGLWAGRAEPYANVLTLDNTGQDGKCEYERGDGFKVQYSDGGYGSICIQAQFPLPNDEATMKAMHKRYRSESGIRTKLNAATLRSIHTTTAKLFTSTEAYSTKSADLQQALKDQIINGSYLTVTEVRKVASGVDDKGNTLYQDKEFAIIKEVGGIPQYGNNPFAEWGMEGTIQFQVTGFDFEKKTIEQINSRRDANNRALTAQDKAKAAYWESEQAAAEGEKARVEAEFREKVKAETAIQQAERDKQLALIEAAKQKEQAELLTQAAIAATAQKKQEVLQAKEEAVKIKTLADAEAYALKEVQKAGELKLKLDAMVSMNKAQAEALAVRQVPQTVIYSGGSEGALGSSDDVAKILDTQLIKNLNNLNLDNKVKK